MSNADAIFKSWLRWNKRKLYVPSDDDSIEITYLSKYLNFGKKLAHMLNDWEVTKRKLKPHIYLIDDHRVNAFAVTHKGLDFIGINTGTSLVMTGLIMRLWADPEFLPDYGDVSKEVQPEPLDVLPLSLDALVYSNPVFTKDKLRNEASRKMVLVADYFLIAHELTHLYHGHAGFWKETTSLTALEENEKAGAHTLTPLTRQALELDADCFAMRLVSAYMRKNKRFDDLTNEEAFDLQMGLVVIYLYFRLMYDSERATWNLDKLDQRKYLPAPLRFLCVIDTFFGHALLEGGEYSELEDLNHFYFSRTLDIGEYAAYSLLRQNLQTIGLKDIASFTRDHRVTEHLRKLEAEWRRLRPLLKQHARTKELSEFHILEGLA